MDKNTSLEKGQAIVMIAISLVVLLGFAALAVDGSMIYSDRRHAQNVADAASLAGGGRAALELENNYLYYGIWNCGDSRAVNAMNAARYWAKYRAEDNNFMIDYDYADNHGVQVVCGQSNNGGWIDKYIDVTVYISSTTETYFAQLIFGHEVVNHVMATTRVRPRSPLAFGNAIVSMSEVCNNVNDKMVFDGGVDVHVHGGGIFSNSCIEGGGSSGTIVVDEPYGLTCVGDDCASINNTSVTPEEIGEATEPMPRSVLEMPVPACNLFHPINDDHGSFTADGNKNGEEEINPGYYDNIKVLNKDDNVVMKPGLYCLSGDFQVSSGLVWGTGVTIFVQSGNFETSGGEVILAGPPATKCKSPCEDYHAVPGVLIYLSPNNTNSVSLLGNGESDYTGLVYAPAGTIEVGGTGEVTAPFHTQLVGNNVQVHGGAEIDINFNGGVVASKAAQIELNK